MNDMVIGYYMSTGAENKMYTLRKRYRNVASGKYFSTYITNLSTDHDTALAKLIEKCNKDGLSRIVDPDLTEELATITRAPRGQRKAEREAREAAQRIRIMEQKEQEENELQETIITGYFTSGKYNGKLFSEVFANDVGYFTYMYHNGGNGQTAKVIKRLVDSGQYTLPEKSTQVLGDEGDVVNCTIEITARKHVSGFYGDTILVLGVAENGAKVKWYSTRKMEVGKKYALSKVTIKKVGEDSYDFNNIVSTITTRSKPKEVA